MVLLLKFIRGVLLSGVYAGFAKVFNIPDIVARVMGVALSPENIWPISLAIGCLLGFISILLWENFAPLKKMFSQGLETRGIDESSVRNIPLFDAICRAYTGKWENVYIDMSSNESMGQENIDRLGNIVIKQVRQFAYDGKLPLWGRKSDYDVWHHIPSEYWKDQSIDWFSFLRASTNENKTISCDNKRSPWQDLMTDKNKVNELWPSVNT